LSFGTTTFTLPSCIISVGKSAVSSGSAMGFCP
jgi:hypothetical protein